MVRQGQPSPGGGGGGEKKLRVWRRALEWRREKGKAGGPGGGWGPRLPRGLGGGGRPGRHSPCHARWSLIHHQAVHPQLQAHARRPLSSRYPHPTRLPMYWPGAISSLGVWGREPQATATSPHGGRQEEKQHCLNQEGKAKRMAGGSTGGPSGWAENPESSEGTLGRQGGQVSRMPAATGL